MAVAKKGFEFFLNRLLKGFRSVEKREPNNLEMILIRQEAGKKAIDANKVIEVNFGKPFNEEIEAMIKSGDVNVGTAPKTPPYQKSQADIEFEIMEKIKADNEKAIKAFESRNPNKPRDEKYTGGMVDVEPNLSDIGHGSDALMARTRLISPGAQGTTSTGLNYLLAEDNDNIRVPFSKAGVVNPSLAEDQAFKNAMEAYKYYRLHKGKKNFRDYMRMQSQAGKQGGGMENFRAEGGRIGFSAGGGGRRAFLKLLATLGGGIAGIKSGILGLGEGTAKKAVTETVKQSAGSGTPPPYFFKLVEKIRTLGDDTLASQDKTIAKKYKDYVMEEDFAGNITIIKKGGDDMYPEEVYMNYKVDDVALKDKKGFAKAEEYEEFTARPDRDGKMKDVEQGVPDEVIEEGTMFEDNITDFGKTKKADGGRIGFAGGKLATYLADKTITGSSRKFLEKVFGKERFKIMAENDPEMHRGMLEVVEMFRNRDKEGLKMYLQKFLPHMDDATIEDFIIGGGGTEGIQGQLIRLGSGRDYKAKLEMMKKADNMRKLENLDVTEEMIRKPNASGGIQTMLGE